MSEALHPVGVLVPDVDAAGVGHVPINDRDLPVVAVVKIDAADIFVDRVEYLHLNTGLPHGAQHFVRKPGQRPEIVHNDVNFHAMGRPLL